jgi:hypothetical protein
MLEFPGEVIQDPDFGELWVPTVPVVWEQDGQMIEVEMIADSGAFLTLLPLTYGLHLGLTLQPHESVQTGQGAGASAIPYVVRRMTMRIGRWAVPVRIGWVQNDLTPALLGRIDVFGEFHIEFRQSERRTLFRRRRRRQP